MAGAGEGYGAQLPSLDVLVAQAGLSYGPVVHALRSCHAMLFPPLCPPTSVLGTWDKLHMERLMATVEQMALLDRVDIRALSTRCADQVACYALCLERCVARSKQAGASPDVLSVLRRIVVLVNQVRSAITPPSAWLS